MAYSHNGISVHDIRRQRAGQTATADKRRQWPRHTTTTTASTTDGDIGQGTTYGDRGHEATGFTGTTDGVIGQARRRQRVLQTATAGRERQTAKVGRARQTGPAGTTDGSRGLDNRRQRARQMATASATVHNWRVLEFVFKIRRHTAIAGMANSVSVHDIRRQRPGHDRRRQWA